MTRWICTILAAFSLMLASQVATAKPTDVVQTEQGAVRGHSSAGVVSFKGVPFAAPPVGALRWRETMPPAPWKGIRDASAYGAPCAQSDRGWNSVAAAASREDCLFLNVWVPRHQGLAALPVMVYFPGGAGLGGSARGDTAIEPPYDGTHLASHGVIVVTANYRLGLFGFLAHPELTAESSHATSGNYALYDQIAALRWVQRNIARFGGDAANVTAFGHSAGSWNLGALMTSPLAKGLFARAILQSNTVVDGGVDDTPRLPVAEQEGRAIAAKLGAPEAGAIAALRARPANNLLNALGAHFSLSTVIADGYIVPDLPGTVFRAGNEVAIPIIIGNAARDGDLKSMGVKGSPKASAAAADAARKIAGNSDSPLTKDDEAAIQEFYGADPDAGLAREALSLYRSETATDGADGSRGIESMTDIIMRCGPTLIATWHGRQSRTWEYQFSHGYEPLGAVHLWDQQYVFGIMIPPADQPADRVLSEAIEHYWTNFAKTGDPNGGGLPVWPEVGAQGAYLDFTTAGPIHATGLRQQACALFHRRIDSALDALTKELRR